MLLPVIAKAFTGMVEINGIYYNVITKAKTAEVTSPYQNFYGGTGYYTGDLVIPETIEYEGVICNVTSIQRETFYKCKNLLSVILPNSIIEIGVAAFQGCDQISSLNIPNSVSSIGGWAFKDCTNLMKIVLGADITEIGVGAFENCTSLTSVDIPRSVTVIDTELFRGCTTIHKISWGDNIEQINPRAFMDCSSLNEISSLSNVKYIMQEAFKGCSSIQAIDLNKSIKTISDGTFEGCSSIKAFTIPDGVTSIGNSSFSGCSSLTTVYISQSVSSVGEYSFGNCPEISDVYCYAPIPPKAETFTFISSYPEYATLHVLESSINSYKEKYPWNSFGNIVAIKEDAKCATPTIDYFNGKIVYACSTDDVEFISEIKDVDIKTYNTSEVNINATYLIEVYAKKSGYNNSEIATATLCWIDMEPKMEGITGAVSEVRALPVLIQSNNSTLAVSGVSDGTIIGVYNTAGVNIVNQKATGTSVTIPTTLRKGEIVIVKINDKAIKVSIQ